MLSRFWTQMAPQGLSSVWDRDFPLAVQMLGSERGMLFHCSLLLVQAKGKDTCPKAAEEASVLLF